MIPTFTPPPDLQLHQRTSLKRLRSKNKSYASVTELLPSTSLLNADQFMEVLHRLGYVTSLDYQPTLKGGFTVQRIRRVTPKGYKYLASGSKIIHIKKSLFNELYSEVLYFLITELESELTEACA